MSTRRLPPTAFPTTRSGAAGGVGGLAAVPGEILRLPPDLAARLLQGARTVILSGTATGRGADSTVRLRTQFGEIVVRTTANVVADRPLSLQIPPLTGSPARLTAAHLARHPLPAKLLLPAPVATAPTAAPDSPSAPITTPAAQAAAGPADGQPPGGTSAGRGAIPTAPPPPGPATGTPATQPSQGTASPVVAMAQSGRAAPTTTPGPSPATAPGAASPIPATGGQPAPQAPAGGRLTLSAQLLTQSGSAPPAGGPAPQLPSSAPAPGQAPVPGHTPDGGLSPGRAHPATETVRSTGATPATADKPWIPPAARPTADPDASEAAAERRVPVLREALSVLSAADPTLARRFVGAVMPQANTQLAATLLFFLSAVRGGDVRGWLGERVTRTLEDAGRGDLLPRLAGELAASARPAAEPAGGEWRALTIPLYQDGALGALSLRVKPAGEEAGDDDGEAGRDRRFLIDVALSRLGPLQLDGRVRDRRLDLIVRSERAFPEDMRRDIRAVFRQASEAVGLTAGLTFQPGAHDWVGVATSRGGPGRPDNVSA